MDRILHKRRIITGIQSPVSVSIFITRLFRKLFALDIENAYQQY